MVINARVKMGYIGDMMFREDGLYMAVTFREPKKLFKTRITKLKIPHKTDEEFSDSLKQYLSDINTIRKDAEVLIRNYFDELAKEERDNNKLMEAEKVLAEFKKNKIKLQVKI